MNHKNLSILLSILLGACGSAPPAAKAPAPDNKPPPNIVILPMPAPPSDIDGLLGYYQSLRDLSAAELAKELASLQAQPKNARLILQKSMVLALGRGSGDLARAQVLVDSVVKSGEPDALPLKPLAQFLIANYAEVRRLIDQADKFSQQIRDGQRRIEQLNETLEALKAIERTLPTRPSGTAPASAPK